MPNHQRDVRVLDYNRYARLLMLGVALVWQ